MESDTSRTLQECTIGEVVEFKGTALHTGLESTMRICPAEPKTGYTFVRTDIESSPELTLDDASPGLALGRTCLERDGVRVETVEHIVAALSALGINNVRVELSGSEPPSGDGSACVFYNKLKAAGLSLQEAVRMCYLIEEPIVIEDKNAHIVALPFAASENAPLTRLSYELNYKASSLARGYMQLDLTQDIFEEQLAMARTFCMESDMEALLQAGLGQGATYQNTLVLKDDRVVENELRIEREPVRHKMLDLIGDIGLLALPVAGRIIAVHSGHEQNGRLVQAIKERALCIPIDEIKRPRAMSITDVQNILPHRYPFLLVDGVMELESQKRILAVKNVSANEEYFTGHFEGAPVMPGVLQIEALAQAAGLMMSERVKTEGSLAALVGVDRVKMRTFVRPGDRLHLEVKVRKMRRSLVVCEGRSTVDGKTATEAVMLFSPAN